MSASSKILQNQLYEIQQNPVHGFAVELFDESNIYEWKVYIEGPQDTFYEGGIFTARLSFPQEYPYKPPTLTFISEFWHPNVYKDGKVCISILHPPGEDEMSGERPEERWNPIQTPETILLSVISMLSDPNFSSPANVDASVELRKNREAYAKRIKLLCEKANKTLPKDFVMPWKLKQEKEQKLKHLDNLDLYDDEEGYVYDPDEEDDEEEEEEGEGEGEGEGQSDDEKEESEENKIDEQNQDEIKEDDENADEEEEKEENTEETKITPQIEEETELKQEEVKQEEEKRVEEKQVEGKQEEIKLEPNAAVKKEVTEQKTLEKPQEVQAKPEKVPEALNAKKNDKQKKRKKCSIM